MNEKNTHSYNLEPTVEQHSQELLNELLTQTKSNLEQHLHQNCGESHNLVGLCVGFILSPKTAEETCTDAHSSTKNKRYWAAWHQEPLEKENFDKLMFLEPIDLKNKAEFLPHNLIAPNFLDAQASKIYQEISIHMPQQVLTDQVLNPFVRGFFSEGNKHIPLFSATNTRRCIGCKWHKLNSEGVWVSTGEDCCERPKQDE